MGSPGRPSAWRHLLKTNPQDFGRTVMDLLERGLWLAPSRSPQSSCLKQSALARPVALAAQCGRPPRSAQRPSSQWPFRSGVGLGGAPGRSARRAPAESSIKPHSGSTNQPRLNPPFAARSLPRGAGTSVRRLQARAIPEHDQPAQLADGSRPLRAVPGVGFRAKDTPGKQQGRAGLSWSFKLPPEPASEQQFFRRKPRRPAAPVH